MTERLYRLFYKGSRIAVITALAVGAGLTSCQNDTDSMQSHKDTTLSLEVGILLSESVKTDGTRAVVTGTQLPAGSSIGVAVADGSSGLLYGDRNYSNVCYTAAGSGQAQTWAGASRVTLTDVVGTVYAYYPYQSADDFDMTAISVDMTEEDQTDWLVATPYEGVCDTDPTASLTLRHALSRVILQVKLVDYSGAGVVESFSIKSDGLGTGGTLDATQGTFTSVSGQSEEFTRSVQNVTLTTENTELSTLVVAAGGTSSMDVYLTVDGKRYTVTSKDVEWQTGYAYTYSLVLSSVGVNLSAVDVNQWGQNDMGDLGMEKEDTENQDNGQENTGDDDENAGEDNDENAGDEGNTGDDEQPFEPSDYVLVDNIYYTKDMTVAYRAAEGLAGAVTIAEGVTSIAADAFRDCTDITSVSLPASLVSIGASAFEGCTSLQSVSMKQGLSVIGSYAFASCTALGSVSLPSSVTQVAEGCFSGCNGLTTVTLSSSLAAISDNMFYDCSSLTDIVIPSSVTSIGASAFYYCEQMTRAELGSGVETIGAGAFYHCSNLAEVLSRAVTAPTLQADTQTSAVSVFTDVKTGGVLTVPTGSSTSYGTWMAVQDGCLGAADWTLTESSL